VRLVALPQKILPTADWRQKNSARSGRHGDLNLQIVSKETNLGSLHAMANKSNRQARSATSSNRSDSSPGTGIGAASAQQVSDLESHVGFWLRFVSNHMSERFRKAIEATGITLSEWVTLRTLYRAGEAGPTELIDSLGMTKGAVSKLIARLEEKKLVTAGAVKEDRRAHRITLTALGRKRVPRLAAIADENDHAFFGHLPRKAQEDLIRLMKEIVHTHGLRSIPVD
jgi:DNA-binding MarR family transcriptional regulator